MRMRVLVPWQVKSESDSIGGTVACVCRKVPPALGEPVFDRLEAKLAHAMLSLPATKGFEFGSGFGGTSMRGSQHNDPFAASAPGNPVSFYADTYVLQPPCCTYGLRVPAACVGTRGAGRLALRRHALYVRRTRTSLGRAVRIAYRGTTGSRPSRRASLCARTS